MLVRVNVSIDISCTFRAMRRFIVNNALIVALSVIT